MDREGMNPIVPGESGDNARWDRLFIRGVLAECDDFTFPANIDIELPGMANGGWGNVLKRTNQPFREGLQSALLSVLDRLIGRRDSTPEQYIAFLSDLIEHPKPKFPAILHVIQHGEILLQKSEHWKIREYRYVGRYSHFLYRKTNSNSFDILVGPEFEARNDLIDALKRRQWILSDERLQLMSNGRCDYRGHHCELRRGAAQLTVRYQTLKVQARDSLVPFMNGSEPRRIDDVLAEVEQAVSGS